MKNIFKFAFITIVITPIVFCASGKNNVAKELKNYVQCEGKSTGISKVMAEAGKQFIQNHCMVLRTEIDFKYCQYRCIGIGMKLIDKDTHKAKNFEINHWMNELKDIKDFPQKEELFDAIRQCVKDVKFTTADKCKTTREVIYCIRNAYREICRVRGGEKWDLRRSSDENDHMKSFWIPKFGSPFW